MKSIINRSAALAFAALVVTVPAVAIGQEPAPVKGMITSHTDSTVVVRTGAGDVPVKITSSTKIRGTSGALGVRGEDHPSSDLIRGLAVSVTTAKDGDHDVATEVVFKNADLKTARQINAGIDSTDKNVARNAQGIAENSSRLDDVGQLMAAGRVKVFFATGSVALTGASQQELQSIAAKAKGMKTAYRVAVVGRADTTGNAAANQKLSDRRAMAVKSYLIKTGGISPALFLPAAGLGDSAIAQDPDPPASNDEARRVTVTLAISKSARP